MIGILFKGEIIKPAHAIEKHRHKQQHLYQFLAHSPLLLMIIFASEQYSKTD